MNQALDILPGIAHCGMIFVHGDCCVYIEKEEENTLEPYYTKIWKNRR